MEDRDVIVDIQGEGSAQGRVVFRDVRGFRVLDEAELTEFWSSYAEPSGWLYEVHEGGWLCLEQLRATFNALRFPLREFLLVDDMCLSVWCEQMPEILG